jgi:hypothetical protein
LHASATSASARYEQVGGRRVYGFAQSRKKRGRKVSAGRKRKERKGKAMVTTKGLWRQEREKGHYWREGAKEAAGEGGRSNGENNNSGAAQMGGGGSGREGGTKDEKRRCEDGDGDGKMREGGGAT